MKRTLLLLNALSIACFVSSCVEPYVPAVVDAPASLLVVDGFINGNGPTRIKLTRTASLAAATLPVEKGATLFVVDDAGTRYAVRETASGTYQSDSLILNPAHQYKLRLTLATKALYESDLVSLKVTPPIDRLSWRIADNRLDVLLSTHDPAQQARYYRWGTTETWEFNSAFLSTREYRNGDVDVRTTPIYTCWRTEAASTIKQATSVQLSQDIFTDLALLSFSAHAERVKIRYSVLVSQYAETPEEFAYYELLRKNTEAVGTVNDPLPSQLTGNVHRRDANLTEPVLGFVSAHMVQRKRLFINRQELPFTNNTEFESPYTNCTYRGNLPADLFRLPDNVPIEKDTVGFIGSSRECVDCRVRGNNVKPSFW